MDRRISIDSDWLFSLNDIEEAKDIRFNDACWQKISLPHDFSVGRELESHAVSGKRGGYTATGTGLYRKLITFGKEHMDKRVSLEFDGIFMNSDVWVNGIHVAKRPYGYISFEVDITDVIKEGLNLIAVRADCSKQTQSRWYNGCGIYRHVWLKTTEKIYIPQWGVFIKTPTVTHQKATVNCEISIANDTGKPQKLSIKAELVEKQDTAVIVATAVDCKPGENTVDMSFDITDPKLWSPESPNMYMLKTEIYANGVLLDSYNTDFGVRTVEFVPNKGLVVNGKGYKLKGVCLHHDNGVAGAVVNEDIILKRLRLLKDMGANAIRTAHNPFSPELYDTCNRLGLFVMDEIFDGWDVPKAEFDYGLYFDEWHERDVTDFVKRDRNHPCVIIWSMGNEVHKMKTEITKKLIDIFHRVDPTRLVTCGVQGTGKESEDNRALLDVAGYNDGGGACFVYDRDHERRPNQLMIATEAPHTSQTRGFYRTQTWWRDKNQPRIEIPNLTEEEIFFDGHINYYSSYDNAGVRVCVRDSWTIAEERPFLCGEFRWCGIDYYGESFGWPTRKTESGIIDSANFPKDHYYLYQSMWVDKKTKPMIHLLPHWTHKSLTPGTIVPIWVYTNCDEAELVLNGRSLGRVEKGTKKHIQWDVPYEAGKITAIAYIDGKEVCQKSFQTAGNAEKIQLTPDKPLTRGATVQVDCTITDKNGTMVPYADNCVRFYAEGAQIIGTENGNPIDHTNLKSTVRKAFNGLLAVTLTKQTNDKSRLFAAALLGETVFSDCTDVSVYVTGMMPENNTEIPTQDIAVYYTTDLSEPNINNASAIRYAGGFSVSETTHVKAAVYISDATVMYLECTFTKGVRDKVIDLTHGNKVLNLDRPLGPFSEKMVGTWSDGGFNLLFKPDGSLVRLLDGSTEQHLGYWWYDFPVDYFEAQDYAGTGEIWFLSGEKETFHMVTQEAREVVIDNSQKAIATAYGFAKEIRLVKQ